MARDAQVDAGGPVVVRRARAEDAETIARFNRAMARETEDVELEPAVIRRGVERAIADPAKGRYWIAERGDEPAGCLLVTREWSDWRDGWIDWIQSVYTAPEQRGAGVYRALHEAVVGAARADPDVRAVRLYVVEGNHAARAVYERLGMQRTDYLLYELALT